MTDFEDLPDVLADSGDCEYLFELVQPWALRYGQEIVEPSDESYGEHRGIRIGIHPIRFEYDMPGSVLHRIVPHAAGRLAVGQLLSIHFSPAFYQTAPEDHCYFNSCVSFVIDRDAHSLRPTETIYIEGADTNRPYATSRMRHDSRLPPPNESGDRDARFREYVAFEALEAVNGLHRLTKSEYEAFSEIAENFENIHEAIAAS